MPSLASMSKDTGSIPCIKHKYNCCNDRLLPWRPLNLLVDDNKTLLVSVAHLIQKEDRTGLTCGDSGKVLPYVIITLFLRAIT